jgi:hypothetical protein
VLFWQTIEGVIDLYRLEVLAVIFKPVGLLHPHRVEYPARPVLIVPATCTHKVTSAHLVMLRFLFRLCDDDTARDRIFIDLDHIISQITSSILNLISKWF